MKKIIDLSLCLILASGFWGCKGENSKIAVGSSCEGIGASEARMHCDGANTLFCSSFTEYKYIIQNTCPEGQMCNLASNGKSASCAAQ